MPIIFIFILSIVAIVFIMIRSGKKPANSQIYLYKNLVLAKVDGTKPKSGISLLKPAELKQISNTAGQFIFGDFKNIADKVHYLGYIAISSQASTNKGTLTDSDIKKIDSALLNTANPYYATQIQPLTDFINDRLPLTWTVQIGKGSQFTNQHIKTSAWLFNFTAKSYKQGSVITGDFAGQALYVISDQNYYYFMELAETNNWQVNQAVWQKVLDSIDINQ